MLSSSNINFMSDFYVEKIEVKGIFDACKKIDPGTIYNDGLSIEEVMQQPCVDFLTTLLGLDEDQIKNDFNKVDTDGNGKVTLKEGRDAFNQLRYPYGTAGFCDFDCCDANGKCEEFTVIMDTVNLDTIPCAENLGLMTGTGVCESK